jgi:prepilin-type N-terminal cleavage/methylation domain-containing protein
MTRSRTIRRGFTLVEAVATMVILSVLAVVTSRLIFTASDVYLASATRSQISSDASAALERIVAEMRLVPVRASSNPAVPDLTGVTATSVSWNAGASGAKSVALSGTDLTWTESGATSRLVRDVSAFSIRAFDESGAALAASLSGSALNPVRTFEVSITVTRSGFSETLRTRVFLRSMQEGAAP